MIDIFVEEKHSCGSGVQRKFKFDNGYTLSAIQTPFSYGGKQGLWEIAVWDSRDEWATKDFFPEHDDDVMGWMEWEEVESLAKDVRLCSN